MFDRKRQHPIAIFTDLITSLKSMIIPILLPLVVPGAGRGRFEFDWVFVLLTIGIPFLLLILSFLKWYFFRFSYSDSDGVLNVYYGVIVKKHKQIKRERVQTVSYKAGLILRLLNLVSLSIETAGGKAEPEFKIKALTFKDADSLKQMLKSTARIMPDNYDDATKAQIINLKYKITFKRLFAAALTSGDIWPIFVLLSVIYSEVSAFIPYETIEELARDLLDVIIFGDLVLIIMGILIVLILTVLISMLKFMLAYANFTVERNGDEILIKRGLIELKHIAFKFHRIQAVAIVEGLLRQPFGFCEVQVNVVGDTTQQNVSPLIHPFVKITEIQEFFDKILPGVFLNSELNKLPKRSLRRYLIRGVLPFLLISPAFYFIPYGYFGILIYPPLIVLAIMKYRDAGFLIKESSLTLRFRKIAKRTILLSKNHIQSLNLGTNYFQKIKDLKTITVMVLSSPAPAVYTVKDLSADCCKTIWNWFSWKGHIHKQTECQQDQV